MNYAINCKSVNTIVILLFVAIKKIRVASLPTYTHRSDQPAKMEIVSALLGMARLHFSLYLIHSIYVRWYWSESRSIQFYTFWDIVSIFASTIIQQLTFINFRNFWREQLALLINIS